jgi:hypothetical protein
MGKNINCEEENEDAATFVESKTFSYQLLYHLHRISRQASGPYGFVALSNNP